MTNIVKIIFLSGFTSFVLASCGTKNTTPPVNNNKLILSSSATALGQYVTAKPQGTFSGTVAYSISPATGTNILTNNNNAAIFFTAPGTYTITGKTSDNSFNENATVTAGNTLYVPNATPDIVFDASDKVNITPALTGSTTFTLAVTTAATLQYLNAQIGYANSSDVNTPIDILFNGIDTANTIAGQNIAVSLIPFVIPANGTYAMQLCMGINCYIGTFTVTDAAITFTFTSNNNIAFTSTTITR